jgi:nucleotide-binding universal stress UspA family protein
MTYKDILCAAITLADDEAGLVAAGELAHKFGARATALIVAIHMDSGFAPEAKPLSELLTDIAKGARSEAALEREKIVHWLNESPHDFDVRDLTIEGAVNEQEIVAHARLAELVVLARGEIHHRARRMLAEHVLFKSGRPLLFVPGHPVRERAWERALIAWNAKPEAMRAVTAALPLLQAAKEVVVVTVDAKPSAAGHSEAPGRELAAHLAHRDVHVEVRNIDSLGRTDTQALLDEAAALGADVLVMGAYGHTRAQEFLFGGVTRDLLAQAPLPLLMAH